VLEYPVTVTLMLVPAVAVDGAVVNTRWFTTITPVPESVKLCVAPTAFRLLSTMFSVAAFEVAVGVKLTMPLHVTPGFRVAAELDVVSCGQVPPVESE
jgi:hypothetical protein